MAVLIPKGESCEIYRTGNAPPALPDVGITKFAMSPAWIQGQEVGDRLTNALQHTHVGYFDVSVDIRDPYVGHGGYAAQDIIYVPNRNGTPFEVVFIERIGKGTAGDCKKVYLGRLTPPWPTNDL